MESALASDCSARIARELSLTESQVRNVIALLDAGNTVPFITRYRKEQTANLDEEQIRRVESRVRALRQLAEKAETILRLIDAQGKLTPELRQQIADAETLKRLDDLYLPFRPRRRSRAEAARELGLEPLAAILWDRESPRAALEQVAAGYVREGGAATVEAALQGAADILAEQVCEDVPVRDLARRIAWRTGRLSVTSIKADAQASAEYHNYEGYSEPVWKVPPHRVLALNRGDKAGALKVRFEWDRELVCRSVAHEFQLQSHPRCEFLTGVVRDSVDRLIYPAMERELRRELSDQAEEQAISVFARNLRSLLLQPPLRDRRVLAVDPGFRTGCKLAVLDECGQCLHQGVVYVTGGADKRAGTLSRLAELVREHQCALIAIGNGTACRETEELVTELIANHCPDCRYLIVNEAGASIYSTSTVGREEFPDFDATVRGTISIGRRLQDPLSELVKIDAQHIGVGMYQHDVTPKLLKGSLDNVVESCVNFVGVDLNTASVSLLRYVSGLNQLIARRVVEFRENRGRFAKRAQLMDVPGIGEATFTQAAGFLKITGGEEPFDSTWIHPESYETARRLLERLGLQYSDLQSANGHRAEVTERLKSLPLEELARELGVGLPTLRDIVDALLRPGRDPRTDLPGPVFRQGILRIEDLQPGMELTGTVLNVVDFGAFVDIGLKDSGLVHISHLADRYVASPHEVVAVGDLVQVWVESVDLERRRVSLTMVNPAKGGGAGKVRKQDSAGKSPERGG